MTEDVNIMEQDPGASAEDPYTLLRARLPEEITDDIVHLFAAVGRYDEIAVAIEKRFGGLVDVVSCEPQMPKQVIQDIQKITG